MTTSPPYSLDDKTVDDLPDLAVEVDELETECECEQPEHRAYPDDGEFDPTVIRCHDKWDLMQCKSCGAVYWRHNARADYGDPAMDAHSSRR